MAITPIYGLPYQALNDPPHGPNLGAQLATAVEAELQRIDANTAQAVQARDLNTTAGTTTSTTYTSTLAGLSALSAAFVVPQSGRVYITISSLITNNTASGPWDIFLGFQLTGGGFTTYGPNDYESAQARNAGANVGGTGTRRVLLTGLPVGSTLTVTLMYKATGGTGLYAARSILIEPAQ